MTAIDPSRCPLCGESNACQVAAGCATCWCFDTPVPAAVLARIPAEAQGVACVCKRCATAEASDETEKLESGRRTAALRLLER